MLNGQLITLRPWEPEDLLTLQQLRNNVNLQSQLMVKPRGSSIEQVKAWLSNRSNDPSSVLFIIADPVNNNVLGYLQLVDLDLSTGIGRLGICISPHVQGKGVGTEALYLLENYMKTMLSLRKIILDVLVSNKKAIKFYLRNGFREVGRLQQHYRISNDFEDVMIMEKMINQ